MRPLALVNRSRAAALVVSAVGAAAGVAAAAGPSAPQRALASYFESHPTSSAGNTALAAAAKPAQPDTARQLRAGLRAGDRAAGARPAGRLRQRPGGQGLHLQRRAGRPLRHDRRLQDLPLRRPRWPGLRVLRRHAAVPDRRRPQGGRRRPRARHERPGAAGRDRPAAHARRCRPRTSRWPSTPSAACSPPERATPATAPGVVDVYDVSQDCRHPVLKSSTPLGVLGHESGFSPDGRTLGSPRPPGRRRRDRREQPEPAVDRLDARRTPSTA